jgi:hypothetical protein
MANLARSLQRKSGIVRSAPWYEQTGMCVFSTRLAYPYHALLSLSSSDNQISR